MKHSGSASSIVSFPAPNSNRPSMNSPSSWHEKAPSVVRATKRQVNEALEDVASTAGSWADADQLGAAMRDPDARAAARAYLASRKR